MDRIDLVRTFVSVAELGSFTRAARSLGVSKSRVSRGVKELEDEFDTALFHRNTRSVVLTESGELLLTQAERLIEQWDTIRADLLSGAREVGGCVRLSVPLSFGRRFLVQPLIRFLQLHSSIRMELEMSDRRADLFGDGLDLAIRIGALSGFREGYARRLAPTVRVLCASPAYLESRPSIRTPADLKSHECLMYAHQSTGATWVLEKGSKLKRIEAKGRLLVNHGETLLEAARAGLGVCLLPDFIVCDAVRDGSLVHVLPAWTDPSSSVWAVYPDKRLIPAKTSALIDFLKRSFGNRPAWLVEPGQSLTSDRSLPKNSAV